MVTPPPWNGPPVSVALTWARLPSVRSVAVRPSFRLSTETMSLSWQRYVILFSIAGGCFAGAIGLALLVVLLALVVLVSQADRRTVAAPSIPQGITTI